MREFGLQIYSVRDKTTTAEGLRDTFKKLRQMGYTQIQTAGAPPAGVSYAEYGKMAAEAGIEIVGTHDNFDLMYNDFDKALQLHQALGTKLMGTGGFFPKDKEDVAVWEEFIEKANVVAANCAKHGMKFTYHNHSFEFMRLSNGKRPMDMLVEGLDPENTSFVLDTYWVQHGGGDVRAWIEKLAGRIDILHLKDMQRLPHFGDKIGYQFYTEIGNGNLEWDLIIDTAEKAGVKYFIVEQDTCPGDSLDSVKISADYLKTKIK